MDIESHSESEEEILVYVEFNDGVDIDKYRSIHVLGIDGKNPIIQADDTFFTGKFENPLGTYMFFEDDASPKCLDPLFDKLPERNVKYLCKTNKLLCMEHAYVMPRSTGDKIVKSEVEEPSGQGVQAVKFNSMDEAISAFKAALTSNAETEVIEPRDVEPMET